VVVDRDEEFLALWPLLGVNMLPSLVLSIIALACCVPGNVAAAESVLKADSFDHRDPVNSGTGRGVFSKLEQGPFRMYSHDIQHPMHRDDLPAGKSSGK
jgi:hypothetical protein